MAAVVDPDGLKANWSLNVKAGGGDWNAGYRKRRTTARSITRIRIGVTVTDIGLKSAGDLGSLTLATGLIMACFHCVGTLDVAIDRLNSFVSG